VATVSETLLGKGPARLALEILFEGDGFRFIPERNSRLDPPRAELGSMGHSAGVVDLDSLVKVFCHPYVPTVRASLALEHIDIPETSFHGVP